MSVDVIKREINNPIESNLITTPSESTTKIQDVVAEKIKGPEGQGLQSLENKQVKPISDHSGYLWDCVGCHPNALGGSIYEFKLKEEYDVTKGDNSAEKQRQVFQERLDHFPAIEMGAYEALTLSPQLKDSKVLSNALRTQKLFQQIRAFLPTFQKLGFSSEQKPGGVYAYFPDKEALEANWEALKTPNMPSLKICSSEGVATDGEYIQAFLSHNMLMSSGKEFLHDMFFHVMPTLVFMLDSANQYDELHQKLQNIVRSFYQEIITQSDSDTEIKKHNPQLLALLGAIADTIATLFSCKKASQLDLKTAHSLGHNLLSDHEWVRYFKGRFGEDFDPVALKELWDKIQC